MISTLVSLSKQDIRETIPGMDMALYTLPTEKDGSVLLIEDSYYHKPDIDANMDKVQVASSQIAESLVHMHLTSQLIYKPDQHPAVFCIPNQTLTIEEVKKKYPAECLKALTAQRRWFTALVQLADDDWQQARRHNMISEIQRIAARTLNLKREWLITIDDEADSGCPFCGSNLLNPDAPICPSCGQIHNPAKYKELQIKLGAVSLKEPEKKQ